MYPPLEEPLTLQRPELHHEAAATAMRREFLAASPVIQGGAAWENYDNFAQWLQYAHSFEDEATTPEGLVAADTWYGVRKSDGALVGILNFRRRLNQYLSLYDGHIGYAVRPSERRKGYAAAMLRLALETAKERGYREVMLTCSPENEASRRTILSCGGVYRHTNHSPDGKAHEVYWVALA